MNLTFRFKHINLGKGIIIKEPIIPITLIGNNGLELNFTSVLDTGSDFILLPLEVAETLELNFDKKNPEEAKVYTGETITTSYSWVRVKIQKGREKIIVSCKCAIQLEKQKQHEHIIFGSSFLENFRILFDYPGNKFQIKNAKIKR